MNREDFQCLAGLRIKEAGILLKEKQYSGAYYLSGYAVECALKAGVSKLTKEFDFPDKTFVNKVYTHKLEELISGLGLKRELQEKIDENEEFFINWDTVKDWGETSRYEVKSGGQAQQPYESITNQSNGILKWIQERW